MIRKSYSRSEMYREKKVKISSRRIGMTVKTDGEVFVTFHYLISKVS